MLIKNYNNLFSFIYSVLVSHSLNLVIYLCFVFNVLCCMFYVK